MHVKLKARVQVPVQNRIFLFQFYLGKYLGLGETKLQENGESYLVLSNMHFILPPNNYKILNRDD